MKKILTLFLLLIASISYAQKDTTGLNLPYKNGKLIYEGIVDLPSKSKTELYGKARLWFVNYFVNSKSVIQTQDKEDGLIIGKFIMPTYIDTWADKVLMPTEVMVQIDCKDNKYRYRLYDIRIEADRGKEFTGEDLIYNIVENKRNMWSKSINVKLLRQINDRVIKIISDINTDVAKSDNSF